MKQIEVNENCAVCKEHITPEEVYDGTAVVYPAKGYTIDEKCETMHVNCRTILQCLPLVDSLRIGLCNCQHCGKPFTLWQANAWHMSPNNPLLHDPAKCRA